MTQARLESVYEQIRNSIIPETTLVIEKELRSGDYACGLSHGAKRYAWVNAQLTFETYLLHDDVVAYFDDMLTNQGWEKLSFESDPMAYIYQDPLDTRLLAGFCHTRNPMVHPTQDELLSNSVIMRGLVAVKLDPVIERVDFPIFFRGLRLGHFPISSKPYHLTVL